MASTASIPEVRVLERGSADARHPVLVYLPGLHGDNTLVGSFRARLGNDVRLLEVTYPTAAHGSLADLAEAVWETLAISPDQPVWLLAESFGSQVAWAMLEQAKASPPTTPPVRGVILAGGFARHPWPRMVTLARWLLERLPSVVWRAGLRVYALWARITCRQAPEVIERLPEFMARRRAPGDQAAMAHRLRLIEGADFHNLVRGLEIPIWHLSGRWDPVVPWWSAQSWLRTHCKSWQGCHVCRNADHVVLATDAPGSVQAVRSWMGIPLTPLSAGRRTLSG